VWGSILENSVSGFLPVLALGFFLGMRHATDPDHVIAIGTIVARNRTTRGAALIGAAWGLGHSLAILLVGGGIIAFSWVIPRRLGLSMELAVGIMLIGLGLASLRHRHEPEAHPHAPDQPPLAWLDRHFGGIRLYQLVRPLTVGVVHGLAGSVAAALLVLAAIHNPRWALLFLFLFSAGTIAGMMLITLAIALPFVYTRHRPGFAGGLRLASGLLSVGFGCLLTYQIGVVQGLFTGGGL
jgi:hypothetical protein